MTYERVELAILAEMQNLKSRCLSASHSSLLTPLLRFKSSFLMKIIIVGAGEVGHNLCATLAAVGPTSP